MVGTPPPTSGTSRANTASASLRGGGGLRPLPGFQNRTEHGRAVNCSGFDRPAAGRRATRITSHTYSHVLSAGSPLSIRAPGIYLSGLEPVVADLAAGSRRSWVQCGSTSSAARRHYVDASGAAFTGYDAVCPAGIPGTWPPSFDGAGWLHWRPTTRRWRHWSPWSALLLEEAGTPSADRFFSKRRCICARAHAVADGLDKQRAAC